MHKKRVVRFWHCRNTLIFFRMTPPIQISDSIYIYIVYCYIFLNHILTFLVKIRYQKDPGKRWTCSGSFRNAYMVYFGMYAKYLFWGSKFCYSPVLGWRFRFQICSMYSGQGLHPGAFVFFDSGLRRIWISVTVYVTKTLF